jgi:rod shape-determining protein MreD
VTPAASPARRALTAVILAAALFAAVVIQLTVVNRLPLPAPLASGSSAAPDLVLLLVTAIAVSTSPATAAVTGFAGGLALDIAPPAAHYAGEYALVFSLAGYAAARVVRAIWNATGERDPVTVFTVMAVAAAAGEAGKAALGLLLSDPDVTVAAVSRVLPAAILYDLLLAPLVYWLVTRLTRAAAGDEAAERAPALEFGPVRKLAPVLGVADGQSVFRQAASGAAPGLRLAGTGGNYTAPPSPPRRVPPLRLSDARAGSSRRTSAAATPGAPLSLAGGRTPRLNLAASRPRRAARPALRTPGKNWLSSAPSPALPAAPRLARSPSRGWLSSAASPALPAAPRAARSPSRGWLSAARGGGRARRADGRAPGLAGSGAPRLTGASFKGSSRSAASPLAARPAISPEEALAARSAPSGLSALAGPGTPQVGHSPQPGWLRGARGPAPLRRQRRSPRRGWLGSASRPRTVIGSAVAGHGRPFRRRRGLPGSLAAQGNWYAGAPSGAWLRRSRHPWRRRLHLPEGRPFPGGYPQRGRPSVPPGARATAKATAAWRARKPGLFGLTGGRR